MLINLTTRRNIMRFSEFFIEYKIALKKTNKFIPWTDLPLYRKVFIILIFMFGVCSIIFALLKYSICFCITLIMFLVLLIVFAIIDAKKNNMQKMLDNYYTVYSQKRMDILINLFNKYHLDIHDKETIDLLIEQSERAKIENDPFLPIKKPLKLLGTIIIPIVIYITKKTTEIYTVNELIYYALILIVLIICFFSIGYELIQIAKDIFYSDFDRYNELSYDLNQLKIFKQ